MSVTLQSTQSQENWSTKERYISVDVEAAGPVPSIYSMLSLGACVVGMASETFYAELRPVSNNAVPEALQITGFSLARLAESGRDPQEAMRSFRDWVAQVSTQRSPVFVGFNASFDWAFVNWYFHAYLNENPFGIAALDIKAYYMGLAGCRWSDTTSSHLPTEYRLNLPAPQQRHNALDDAIAQGNMFEKMLLASR